MLWCEKYCPSKIEDVKGNKIKINNFINYIKSDVRNPILVIKGPCGIGKSTIVRLVLKQQKYNIVEFNYSNIDTKKKFSEKIRNIFDKKSIDRLFYKDGKRTSIVIDEAENINTIYYKELVSLIKKRKKEKKKIRTPVILITNGQKKIASIKSYNEEITFRYPQISDYLSYSNNIINNENMNIDDEALITLIKYSQKDFRQLTYILYYFYIKYKHSNITLKNVENVKHILMKKDRDYTIYEVTDKILNNYNNISDSIRLTQIDKTLCGLMVHENYLSTVVDNRKSNRKDEEIAKISDILSQGDLFEKNVIVDKIWELDIDTIFLRTVYPSYLLNSMDKYAYNKNNNINFTKLLNSTTQSYTFFKNMDDSHYLSGSDNEVNFLKTDLLLHTLFHNKEEFFSIVRQYNIDIDRLDKFFILDNAKLKSNITKKVKRELMKEYEDYCESHPPL